jgi:hypothetical protein
VPAGADMLVWDTKKEWAPRFGLVVVTTLKQLREKIGDSLMRGGPSRLAYQGPVTREHFDIFCRLAWVWIKAKKRRVLAVEELADVTNPGKALQAWGEILRKGRDPYEALVIGLTQRASESDSTIAGNCSLIHAGFQSFPRDRKTIAEYLDAPLEEVRNLGELDWIERDMRTREIRRGRLEF